MKENQILFDHGDLRPRKERVGHFAKFSRRKRARELLLGFALMLLGAAMVDWKPEFMPKVGWEALCYGLHGLGGAPVIKLICELFRLDWL